MNIEFHTPASGVDDWLIGFLKERIMNWHKMDQGIGRAEVILGEHIMDAATHRFCEIRLDIYSNTMVARREGDTYEKAAKEVIRDIESRENMRLKKEPELPEDKTSTIEV